MDKAIPRALNYADIKPEAIDSQVKVVRFTPTATINYAKPNDLIRFQLQGQGFYDPYSAYVKIQVQCDMNDFAASSVGLQGRFLDRSAHSIINRLVVRSQGTEIERIEQYDVVAAMINDMLYSHEQKQLHHVEGFPTKQANILSQALSQTVITETSIETANDQQTAGVTPLYGLGTTQEPEWDNLFDQGFWKYRFTRYASAAAAFTGGGPFVKYQQLVHNKSDSAESVYRSFTNDDIITGGGDVTYQSSSTLEFCIPLYSGILGVLMPEKKMIPLSLMPLELEFTVNPYAFYDVGTVAQISNPRTYTVSKFWIYSHVLFFEQELHRSLEAVTAESGIFIHFNSFYLAPITTHVGSSVTTYAQINVHAKSINSIHFVFLYKGYEQLAGPRKLHFCNHNLKFLQIRNGTDLIPSEPLEGSQDDKKLYGHAQFLLETFKAWGKMHDPTTDACINCYNYTQDKVITRPTNFFDMVAQQAQLGRCQYAISMEGEELGMDKTIITGRKGMIPFDINMNQATKSSSTESFQFIFTKADYLVYVRPDLVVQVLGR